MCEVKALEMIYGAVRVIAVYLLFCSVLFGILPDSPFKQYVRLFAGLLLLLLFLHSFSVFSVDVSFDLEEVLEDSLHASEFKEKLERQEEASGEKITEEISGQYFQDRKGQDYEMGRGDSEGTDGTS